MKTSASALLTLVAAVALVAGVTVVQGFLTERWSDRNDKEELLRAAELLEKRFPVRCGDWERVEDIKGDPKELERAGAVGHVSRVFRNTNTKMLVSAFVVCATPHDASGHTPDRCYPGAGFEMAESEHRHGIPLEDGRTAETFTATFRKESQTLRIYWTYGVGGKWIAPQIARIELAGAPAVYKLYAIIDESATTKPRSQAACTDFLAALLPEIDRSVGMVSSDRTTAETKAADAKASETTPAGTKPAGATSKGTTSEGATSKGAAAEVPPAAASGG